ncbi:hypothetical protein WN48_03510 [Eufriesea mexicana]|uniref:Uncharacterized protein n=1 Tax=Eufriesea mexicana TaxID=516756 RepID=A0A310SAP7_9HYME|nr:hypothetical protein WN48_03510 [Eufriesea mexicana]
MQFAGAAFNYTPGGHRSACRTRGHDSAIELIAVLSQQEFPVSVIIADYSASRRLFCFFGNHPFAMTRLMEEYCHEVLVLLKNLRNPYFALSKNSRRGLNSRTGLEQAASSLVMDTQRFSPTVHFHRRYEIAIADRLIATEKRVRDAKRYRSRRSTRTRKPSEAGHCRRPAMRASYDGRRSGNEARMKGEREREGEGLVARGAATAG